MSLETRSQRTGFLLALALCFSVWTSGPSLAAPASPAAPAPTESPTLAPDAHDIELVGHIGGEVGDVFVQGSYAYVGEGTRLTILDVSDPTAPIVLGGTPPFPVAVTDVYVSGNQAYVSADGLRVVDISNPAAPVEVGFYAEGDPVGAVVGALAYAGRYGRLQVLDVSDPTQPVEIGEYDTYASCSQGAVTAQGDTAYVASCHGLWVLDVSDPAHPQLRGSYSGIDEALGVAIAPDGTHVYVADYLKGLWALDVSDPSAPTLVGYAASLQACDVTVAGQYAYVAHDGEGFGMADVSDPANPFWAGKYQPRGSGRVVLGVAVAAGAPAGHTYAYLAAEAEGLTILDVSLVDTPKEVGGLDADWEGYGVAVQGSYAYVAAMDDGLQVVDVSNPLAPTPAGAYTPLDTSIWDVAVSGAYAYTIVYTDYHRALQIVDISNPTDPLPAGSYTPSGDQIYIENVAVGGGYAYVATGSDGLRVVDVSDPNNPTEVAHYTDTADVSALALAGHYAYLTGNRTMDVVDISDPAAPVRVGVLEPSWYGKSIALSGSYAYIPSSNPSGLRLIDVSDPAHPTEVGFCESVYGPAAVSGNVVYIADGSSSLDVVDVSDPTDPVPVYFRSSWNAEAEDVTVAGGYAYAAVWSPWSPGGLRTLDISHVGAPHEAAAYTPPAQSQDVAVAGGYAYVADGQNGMQVVNVSDPAAPSWVGKFYNQEIGEQARAITLSGDVAYLGQSLYLSLLDIANPAASTELGRYCPAGTVQDVAVSDDIAYVIASGAGLKTVDVSDPANPAELGAYDMGSYYPIYSVALAGNLVGVGSHDLWVVDVSDPTTPALVGSTAIGALDLASAARPDILYAAAGEEGLAVIQVSAVTSPTLLGSFGRALEAADVAVTPDGRYAYVVNHAGDDRLQILDISNPDEPWFVGLGDGAEPVYEVAIAGSYAYAAGDAGLQVWDISNPAAPLTIGLYDPDWFVGQVIVAGDYAYLPHGTEMAIVDISNPAAPSEVGSYQLSDPVGGGYIADVAVSGNYAYVAARYDLLVVDVSNPAAPAEVGLYQTGGLAVAATGSVVYLAASDSLHVVDASNPAAPALLGRYTETFRSPTDIVLVGDRVYLHVIESSGQWYDGLRVVDVADPANPTLLGAYDTPYSYDRSMSRLGLAVQGTHAYLAAEESGLGVVDVSEPTAPTESGFYIATGAWNVAAHGDLVYVGSGDRLYLVDASNPAAPRRVGVYELPSAIQGLTVDCEYLYAAAGEYGLYLLHDADAACYTLSGRVTDAQGQPLAGVQVAAGTHQATTGADGQYTLADLAPGSYTLTPDQAGYFFTPETRQITIPPDATGQDFVGRHIVKESNTPDYRVVGYGQPLTYTLRLVYPDARAVALYDAVPTYTTYISGSLSGPAGLVYDPAAGAISGTVTLAANTPVSVAFALRVAITGTAQFGPLIVNRACVYPEGGSVADCEWSNEIRHYTFAYGVYLPLVVRND